MTLLAAIGIAACGPVAPAVSGPTAAAASGGPGEVPSITPGLRANGRDPVGDLVDGNGTPVPGPRSLDITRLEADALGADLRIQLTVVGAPAPTLPDGDALAAFVFGLDTAGDSRPEFFYSFDNLGGGGLVASLQDVANGKRLEGSALLGGSIVLQERVVLAQLPLSILGTPARLRICAFTQVADAADGRVVARDNAPDGDCRLGEPAIALE